MTSTERNCGAESSMLDQSQFLDLITSKLKLLLSAEVSRIDTRLAVIEVETKTVNEQVKAINGSVRTLSEWRAHKEPECAAHQEETKRLRTEIHSGLIETHQEFKDALTNVIQSLQQYQGDLNTLKDNRAEWRGTKAALVAIGAIGGSVLMKLGEIALSILFKH